MALLDTRSDAIVIRVVYDGAPMAGKTTSVCALGDGLGAKVLTPAEVGGRTLYFDWLDYTGGLFEGRRIRCQIVSVPGQASLAPRRRRLLESADVVVFVGDSSPAGFEADRAYLRGLSGVLGRLRGPPVGILLQANKRDLPDAVSLETLRSLADEIGMRIAVVESIATKGTGIREAFVFAVRLALDRVRELARIGQLQMAQPRVESAQDLLEELRRDEEGTLQLAAASDLKHTRLTDVRAQPVVSQLLAQAVRDDDTSSPVATDTAEPSSSTATYIPATPDAGVASGLIWPPVDGRLILHELAASAVTLSRSSRGDWSGIANDRWRIHSAADARFPQMEEGRAVLIQAARQHAANARGSSVDRCVVLASDGGGYFRLWQIERMQPR